MKHSYRIDKLKNHLQGGIYIEKSKHLEILTRCEVLIVGGGPAGLSAAIASARAGADTIIMERHSCFGGVITNVGMETIGWYRYPGTVDCEGVGTEMERIAQRIGASQKFPFNDSECLDTEKFKLLADELIQENNVRPLLHCYATDVARNEKNEVIGVITESKSGRKVIYCKRIVDATGDADIFKFAQARFTTLPVENRLGVTTVFNISGVDKDKFLKYVQDMKRTYKDWSQSWDQKTTGKEDHLRTPYLGDEFDEAEKEGVIPPRLFLGGSWSSITDHGEIRNLNLAHMKGIDSTNVVDLTKAEIMGRKLSNYALSAMQAKIPGCEKATLRNFASTLGIRDSRKIVGKYNLTKHDVMNEARFEDSVGVFPEFIDGYKVLILPTTGRYFQLPYRCLQSPDVDNILAAGRCVAGDKISHAAVRNMMCCTVTGQAAGVAAAVSLEYRNTSETPIEKIQDELRKQKVKL